MIEFPNKEHRLADEAARRRALAALRKLTEHAERLTKMLERGPDYRVDPEEAYSLLENSGKVPAFLGALDALYDVRQAHAADLNDARQKRAEIIAEAEEALQVSEHGATWSATIGEVYDKAAGLAGTGRAGLDYPCPVCGLRGLASPLCHTSARYQWTKEIT